MALNGEVMDTSSRDISTIPGTNITIDMKQMLGPFVLAFHLEVFMMGIVLVISINYFVYIKPTLLRPVYSSHRTLESVSISVSLVFSLTASGFVVYRAWDVFAVHALDPFYTYTMGDFTVPVAIVAMFPTVINQTFLTTPAFRFLAHSQVVMPRLSRTLIRYLFAIVVGALILAELIANIAETVMLWQAKSLANLIPGTPTASIQGWDRVQYIRMFCRHLDRRRPDWSTMVGSTQLFVKFGRRYDGKSPAENDARRLSLWTAANSDPDVSGYMLQIRRPMDLFPLDHAAKIYNITLFLAISAPHIIEPTPTPSNIQLPTIQGQSTRPQSPPPLVRPDLRRGSTRFSSVSWRAEIRHVLTPEQRVQYPGPEESLERRSIGRYERQQDLAGDEEKQTPQNSATVELLYPPSISTAGPRTPHAPLQFNEVTSHLSSAQITSNGSMPDSVLFWRVPSSSSTTIAPTIRPPNPRRCSDSGSPSPRDWVYPQPTDPLRANERNGETRMTASSPPAFGHVPFIRRGSPSADDVTEKGEAWWGATGPSPDGGK